MVERIKSNIQGKFGPRFWTFDGRYYCMMLAGKKIYLHHQILPKKKELLILDGLI